MICCNSHVSILSVKFSKVSIIFIYFWDQMLNAEIFISGTQPASKSKTAKEDIAINEDGKLVIEDDRIEGNAAKSFYLSSPRFGYQKYFLQVLIC